MSSGLIKGNGYSYYVPDNVDDTTTAFIYYPGAGGAGNDAAVLRDIIQGNPNQIIIIADIANQDINKASDCYFNLIQQIGNENGATISNIVTMGFSMGGPNTFRGLIRNINDHPEAGPQTAVFVDVVQHNGFYGSVNGENIATLKNNGASLLFFEPYGTIEDAEKVLASNGVDVVVAWASGEHAGHVALNRDAFKNGIVDLTSADIDSLVNSGMYTFVKYNSTTGKWDQITMEEVADRFANNIIDPNDPFRYYKKLGNLKELQCSNEFIASKVNGMRNAIKNTNFLTTTGSDTYSSTTKIPNVEAELIQNYFTTCSTLLSYLEKDTIKLIQVGNSIDDINKKLKNEAGDLNNSISYYNGNPNTNTGSYTTYSNSYTGALVGGKINAFDSLLSSTEDAKVRLEKIEKIKKEFLKYDELYSDDGKIVYEKEGEYKVVIHHEEDDILTLEYYFDYETEEAAKGALAELKSKYEGVEDVLNEGRYVKLIFAEDVYKGLSLDELKKMYEDLKELKKEE